MAPNDLGAQIRAEADRLALTAAQRPLWSSQRRAPGVPLQNMANVMRFGAPVDPDRLDRAFLQVVQASDALRSRIVEDTLSLHPEPPSASSRAQIAPALVQGWAEARARRPIDMARCGYDSVILCSEGGAHAWYLSYNHLLMDASGLAQLLAAVAQAYSDGAAPTLGTFYGEEAAADPAARAKAEAYWAQRAPAPQPPALYAGSWHPAPASSRKHVAWNAPDQAALESYVRSQKVFPGIGRSAAYISAMALLIHRLTGAERFSVGIAIGHPSQTIGTQVELFPVDIHVPQGGTHQQLFSSVLEAVTTTLRQAVPGTAPKPDFAAVLNMLQRGTVPAQFGDTPLAVDWIGTGAIDPEHMLRVHETWYGATPGAPAQRLELDVQHAAAKADAADRLPAHFAEALRQIVTAPDRALGAAPLCPQAERSSLGAGLTGAPALDPIDLPTALRAALEGNPQEVLRDGDHIVTGEALWRWSCAIAQEIKGQDRIGIALPPSAQALAAIYGAVLAGCAFVPIDPAASAQRKAALGARAGLSTLFEDPAQLEGFRTKEAPQPATEGDPDSTAYVIFTSGSTGEPKGVPISRRGLGHYLAHALGSYFDGPEPPVAALFGALTFDLTITTLFAPILAGGRLVVLAADGARAMAQLVAEPEITWVKATPSHLKLFARLLGPGHGLRAAIVGGEAFGTALAQDLTARLPGLVMFNEYGPTEAVVGCVVHRLSAPEPGAPDVPIGAPIPGTALRICDAYGQLTPWGAAGELWISNPGVTAGYLGAEETTPISQVDGLRFYRSGDLVRMRDDGVIEYLGRIDSQLKMGGVRLDPGEVEAALCRHPAIAAAHVGPWAPRRAEPKIHCTRCGLPDTVPGARFDAEGVCQSCHAYDRVAPMAEAWFKRPEDLQQLLAQAKPSADVDCVHLLSGGKDSAYALYRLVDLGFRPFALTLDNGFISEGAKENARRMTAELGIPHAFATTPAMNAIFAESLQRHANVCHGCFKTIYTLGLNKALELGAPIVTTGLSRGQLFETRLTPGQFQADRFDPERIDAAVREARRIYHRAEDEVRRALACPAILDGSALDQVQFVDFYRYENVSLSDMLAYLAERTPWLRPKDTGRSTNCLVNAAGIHTHLTERGYHNYAIPYAWDVRLGHKTRDEAIAELQDDLDQADIADMLGKIGYTVAPKPVVTAWLQRAPGVERVPTAGELRAFLSKHLPPHALPAGVAWVAEFPMTPNGKLDAAALPPPDRRARHSPGLLVTETTKTQAKVRSVWERVLKIEPIGIDDDFFALGGDSLMALDVVMSLSAEFGITLRDDLAFIARTPRALAAEIDQQAQTAQAPLAVDFPQLPPQGSAAPEFSAGEEILALDQRGRPNGRMYNVGRIFQTQARLDGARLRDAVVAAALRHEPLRWTYGTPRRKLAADEALHIEIAAAAVPAARLREAAEPVHQAPFDLAAGPALRARIQPLEEGGTALILAAHHIRCDHEAFDQLWAQIADAYAGAAVPEMGSYAAVSAWHAQHAREAAQAYWLQTPAPAALRIQEPAAPEPDGYLDHLCSVRSSEVKAATMATPVASLLAAVAAGLRPWMDGDAVELGLVSSARIHPASKPLFGYFLNPLPVQLEVSEPRSIAALSDAATRVLGEVLPHRAYPLGALLADRRKAGLPAAAPQVLVSYDDPNIAPIAGAPVTSDVLPNPDAVAPMSFFLQLRGDDVHLGLEYAGKIGRGTAQEILERCAAALASVVRGGAQTVERLPLPGARPLIGPDLPEGPLLLTQIAVQAERHPDRPAVLCGETDWTWAQLDAAATQLAGQLVGHGVAPGDRVLVHMPRSPELVAAILGTLRAGAAYVPVDVSYPEARVATIKASAAPAFTLTPETYAKLAAQPDDAPALPEVTAEDIAYVIFTSGSTGTPRGVPIPHGALSRSTSARDQVYPAPPERFAMLSSPAFDSSVVGLFWPLARGGTIVLPTEQEAHDVDALAALISRTRASHLLCVPTLYRALLMRRAPSTAWVQEAIVAGEACPPDLVSSHFAAAPEAGLVNEYGPTEATVWATVQRVQPGDPSVPIGQPIAGTWAAVLDDADRLCPSGVPGALVLGGPNIAGGYTTQDAEDRFQPTAEIAALADLPGARVFRSGDRALIENGRLRYLGRADDQLNIGGARVEPGEVEAALMRTGLVEEALVTAQDLRPVAQRMQEAAPDVLARAMAEAAGSPDPNAALERALHSAAHAQLVAHVIAEPSAIGALRLAVAEALPPLMRPARYGAHAALPRTPNGKLDRAAATGLQVSADPSPQRAPRHNDQTDDRPNVRPDDRPDDSPDDPLIEDVRAVFADALGQPELGADSSFFDAGGDSIAAIRVLMALEDRAHGRLPTSALYDAPTARQMAALLRPAPAETDAAPLFIVPCDVGFTAPPPGFHKALSQSRPVVYLEHPLLRRAGAAIWDTSALAQIYVDEIEARVPEGPIHLGAFCIGAYVATEMARILAQKGRPLDHMLLFDPSVPPRQVERLRFNRGLPLTMARIRDNAPSMLAMRALERALVGRRTAMSRPSRRARMIRAALIAAAHARHNWRRVPGHAEHLRPWPRGVFVAAIFEGAITPFEGPVSVLASEETKEAQYDLYPDFLDAMFPNREMFIVERTHYAVGATEKTAQAAHECLEAAISRSAPR